MFHYLEQGNGSVEEYARELESYLMKCGVNEDEPQTLVRFLGGLDSRTAQVVDLHPYTNLNSSFLLTKWINNKKSRPNQNLKDRSCDQSIIQEQPPQIPNPIHQKPPQLTL